jgi:hypothetical protein
MPDAARCCRSAVSRTLPVRSTFRTKRSEATNRRQRRSRDTRRPRGDRRSSSRARRTSAAADVLNSGNQNGHPRRAPARSVPGASSSGSPI